MVARTKKTDADTAAPDANPEPAAVKKERKPRVPKPVTDLSTANAAFQAAKRKAERATKAADAARKAEQDANQALAAAAGVLKGYLGEVDAAVGNVLPVPASDLDGLVHGGYGDNDAEEDLSWTDAAREANDDESYTA